MYELTDEERAELRQRAGWVMEQTICSADERTLAKGCLALLDALAAAEARVRDTALIGLSFETQMSRAYDDMLKAEAERDDLRARLDEAMRSR